LARAVEGLIKNKKALRKMGKEAKKWSENFSWEKAGKESYNILFANEE
jgi:glycosyltransferase involved in cell wall biosynthesis